MDLSKIWLSSPHMGGSEEKYVQEAFDTNWVAPLGPNVDAFEESLQKYLKEPVEVAALSSGTAALHLGLVLLDVKSGDEVLCQSMTFSASANPIVYQGATPVFLDSESHTWNLCPQALEEAILDRIALGKLPKAIVAVHLYGMPYEVDKVREIADRYGIPILEDSAEALGSQYKGQHCGTFGDISVLSFNGNKIITTSGGGAMVTRRKDLRDKAVFLATQARDNAPHYQHSHIGYNYRMSNIVAGIGRGQMEVLDDHVAARRGMHEFYHKYFREVPGVELLRESDARFYSNHWLSCIKVDAQVAGWNREELRLFLAEKNIESRPLWKPMHLQPVFERMPYYGGKVAEQLFYDGLCLPSGSNLGEEERGRIVEALDEFLGARL
jgi:dTDP-4-amino-4,6-dideoxygalactose transaminase